MRNSPESIWIIGYGKFGRRAVEMMIKKGHSHPLVTVIDKEPRRDIPNGIEYIRADGIKWFIDNFRKTSVVNRIIPALPVHLAAQWIKGRLISEKRMVREIPVPPEILPLLPNPYRLSADTYVVSHADFLCPPDCIEPEEFCTVTCKPRPTPLYNLLDSLPFGNVVVLTMRSHQFAPGVGGFYADELWQLLDKVQKHERTSFLLCTACKCHGVISAFQLAG